MLDNSRCFKEACMQAYDLSFQALADRVTRVEAQNRRLKKATIAALVLVSAVLVMGQAGTRRILEANEFVLKDNSGTARARLSMETTNRPTLTFYGEKNPISASLAGGDEPFLILNRAGTDQQVQLGANRDFYGLGLYEKEIRAGISVQNGNPGIELFNESGKPRVSIEAGKTGEFILLGDTAGKESSMLWNSGVSILGKAGSFRLELGEEGPSLDLKDNEGYSTTLGRTDLIALGSGRKERTPAASLVLFGKDRKVLWSAP
jgi:hypothetical protein